MFYPSTWILIILDLGCCGYLDALTLFASIYSLYMLVVYLEFRLHTNIPRFLSLSLFMPRFECLFCNILYLPHAISPSFGRIAFRSPLSITARRKYTHRNIRSNYRGNTRERVLTNDDRALLFLNVHAAQDQLLLSYSELCHFWLHSTSLCVKESRCYFRCFSCERQSPAPGS